MFRNVLLGTFAEEAEDHAPAANQATSAVDDLIAGSDVVVFVSSSCPDCTQAIDALKAADMDVTVVERTPEMAGTLVAKTGSTSVPSAFPEQATISLCMHGRLCTEIFVRSIRLTCAWKQSAR